jgi:MFS family permease
MVDSAVGGPGGKHSRCSWIARKCPIYYGYVVIALCIAGQAGGACFGSIYINTLTMPRVYDDMLRSGVSRQTVSTMWLCGTLCAAAATPFYGRMIDRFGARLCEPAGLVVMAVGMVCLSQVPGDGKGSAVTSLALAQLAASFFLIRSAALGMLNPYYTTVINQWWQRRRGMAIAAVGTFYQLIAATNAQLYQAALDGPAGWRQAILNWSLVPALVTLPMLLLLFRTPESVGLLPDGDPPGSAAAVANETEPAGAYAKLSTADDDDNDGGGDAEVGGRMKHRKIQYLGSRSLEEASMKRMVDFGNLGLGKPSASSVPVGGEGAVARSRLAAAAAAAAGGSGGIKRQWTRAEALRTRAVWMLATDKFFSAVIGAGCSQVLLQVLLENDAVGVDIAKHVMIPNGLAQVSRALTAACWGWCWCGCRCWRAFAGYAHTRTLPGDRRHCPC